MAWELYLVRGGATLEGMRVRVMTGQRDAERKLLRVTPVRDPNDPDATPAFGVYEIAETDFERLDDGSEPPGS